jgi:hypothetical protein
MAVDAVAIFDHPQFLQAWLFRYRAGNSEDQFALAQPGSKAITDRDRLDLAPAEGIRVVSFEVPAIERSYPTQVRRHLKFQLIRDSGAVTVRTMDYHEGEVIVDSISYPVRLVLYNATSPYFVRETTVQLFRRLV